MKTPISILLIFLFTGFATLLAQPVKIGEPTIIQQPTPVTKPNTTNNTSKLNEVKKNKDEKQFLHKYELYNKIKNILPYGWDISERQSNLIIFRDSVVILKETITQLNDVDNGESFALRNHKKTQFAIILRFESYPESLFLAAQENNDKALENIENLRIKYKLDEMMMDEETSLPIAFTKEEKNNLAKFWVEKEILQGKVSTVPEYYVHDFGVSIEYPWYSAIYPTSIGVQAEQIYGQIKNLLKRE